MSDSTTHLDTIAAGDSAKETKANSLFDAMSPNSLFGRRASTTSALTWGYYGGKYRKADGSVLSVANATLALTASATNYILQTDGVVSKVTVAPAGWPGPLAANAKALYEVVCGVSSVTSYTDYRTAGADGADGAAGAGVTQLTTKGDLLVFTTLLARLAVGTNGQVLTADSAEASGIKWASAPFDVHAFYPGVPTASAKVLRIPVARAVTFPDDFAGSYAKASANATASTAFDVQKNGVSVGTITFALGAATGTFVTSGTTVVLAAGDVLSIIAPASADATLADIGIVLAGTR